MKSRLSLVIALLLIAACSTTSGRPKLNTISVEDEWQLGAQMSRDLSQQLQFVTDPDALAYLRNIGTRLVAQSNMSSNPWDFLIVRDDRISAYSIPGGHVYVSTGLIKAAHNTAELAAAVAVEVAHGVERHAAQSLSQKYGVREVADAAVGKNASVYQQLIANRGATQWTSDQEKDADSSAINLLDKAGYDAKGLANWLRTMKASDERIKAADEKASKLAKRSTIISDEPEFHTIREKLQ